MFRVASDLNGYTIVASDGPIGHVSDILFDDLSWMVRWTVVETGSWLMDRKVLLPPFALDHLDPQQREFAVKLSKLQVKNSPDIDADKSVSRQMETYVYDYYGWSPYWGVGFDMGQGGYLGGMAAPPSLNSRRSQKNTQGADQEMGDTHLRSARAVTGYHIHASDGAIGHVRGFLIEDVDWSVRYLIVKTSNWIGGEDVIVPRQAVRKIDWAERSIWINIGRQEIKDGPRFRTADQTDQLHFRHALGSPDAARGKL